MIDCWAQLGVGQMSEIEVRSANLDQLVVGQLGAKWSARGDRILRYYIDFRHEALNLHKEVSAPELFILQGKVDALMASWDEKYAALKLRRALQSGVDTAAELEIEEHAKRRKFESFLQHTLRVDDRVDWESLKDRSEFKRDSFREPKPRLSHPDKPAYEYPTISFFQKLFGKAQAILDEAEALHQSRIEEWERHCASQKVNHLHQLAKWNEKEAAFNGEQERLEREFNEERDRRNAEIDELHAGVSKGDVASVLEHATMVLDSSDYEGLIEKSFELDYQPDTKTLLVEYQLPTVDDVPNVKTVRFVKASGELKETFISEREAKSIFDGACYQIALRTIHELFEADEFGNVQKVLFNGFVEFTDPRTGNQAQSCILSVMADRTTFETINLANVDPKACFKSLKGVSAATLASYAAVPPIMKLDRSDKRFVEGKDVIDEIPQDQNLASMSWEDFEHLIRELFEKEFALRGGEVKVTQASRDGGVDAVAFDPDPISGGKIVIQAKRYTRTVGVSAVRDLYGTVLNEGANKGILVSTADYGPDAYQFATDKPLSLLNGGNLLHMLERHGYRAKIDLIEAREAAGL